MKKRWQYLNNLGIHDQLSEEEKGRVRLLNIICVITGILMLVINSIQLFFIPLPNSLVGFIGLLHPILTLWFIYQRKYNTALHFYLISIIIMQVVWCILLAGSLKLEISLFAVPAFVALLAQNWKFDILYFVIIVIGLLICNFSPYIIKEPLLDPGNKLFTNILTSITISFFIMIAMRYFQRNLQKAQAQSNQLMQQLQTKNEDLNLFTTTASHDMKEPLRMISSFGNLLERKYKKELKGDGMEYLAFIQGATSRMETLLNDLLSYSKAGIETHAPEEVDLNKIVKKVKNSLHLKIEDTNAIIESDHLPTLQLHPTAIYQVFQNLISNGLKYQPLLINSANELTHQAQINITVKKESANYLFSIQDNGIGIPTSKLPHVFDIFNRAHTQTEYEGTGVGLAICKKIVEGYGGKIWVESVEGKGATFFFTLPH